MGRDLDRIYKIADWRCVGFGAEGRGEAGGMRSLTVLGLFCEMVG